MVVEAKNEHQLANWLSTLFAKFDPSKVSHATNVANINFKDQQYLDLQLITMFGHGLETAAHLAGDRSNYLMRNSHKSDPEKLRKVVGGRRCVRPIPEPRKRDAPPPPPQQQQLYQNKHQKKREMVAVPSHSKFSLKSTGPKPNPKKKIDPYMLSNVQKEFLRDARADDTMLVYEANNPKRDGTESFDRYESYKTATTIQEAIDLGAKTADIPYDYSRGYVTFPDSGEFAEFRFMMGDEDSGPAPTQKRTKFNAAPARPALRPEELHRKIQRDHQIEKRSSSLVSSAWEVTDEDMKSRNAEEDAVEETFEGEVGAREWQSAKGAYEAADWDEALDYLIASKKKATGDLLSNVERLLALVKLKTVFPTKSAFFLVKPTTQVPARAVHFPEQCPTLREGSEKRDLAKETRQENHLRHEPRGVVNMFDVRVKEMLDELLEESRSESPATELVVDWKENVVRAEFEFKGSTSTGPVSFRLHKRSVLPANAKLLDETVRTLKGADLDGLVQLLRSVKEQHLVNKYGKGGCTALTLTAKAGRQDLVEELLEMGADASNAVDGAVYLSERRQDMDWILALLKALHELPSLIPPNEFINLVRFSRKKGDTALLVAVNLLNVEATRLLLEWGALVEDSNQRRSSDQATCYEVAQEKGTTQIMDLLDEHRKAERTEESH